MSAEKWRRTLKHDKMAMRIMSSEYLAAALDPCESTNRYAPYEMEPELLYDKQEGIAKQKIKGAQKPIALTIVEHLALPNGVRHALPIGTV